MNTSHGTAEDIYEEVIVSTNQPYITNQSAINVVLNPSTIKAQNDSVAMEADSDSDYEDDEMNGIRLENKTKEPNKSNIVIVPETSPNSNIKLVLKKSPGFEISKHPLVQAKTATNKIFVVTLVTNAATKPVFTTANYTVASPAANMQPIITNILDSTKSPISSVSSEIPYNSSIKLAVGHQASTEQQQRERSIDNVGNFNIEKSTELQNKEENDDLESIQSGSSELKTSTPKTKRELVQLQKTVNESKILSEYMSESASSKGRKSKKIPLKTGSDTEYTPFLAAARRSRSRSCSKPRLDSPVEGSNLSKWPSEERLTKRNMRSQNTEFMQKHMKFLNRIHAEGDMSDNSDGENSVNDSKSSQAESQIQIIRRSWQPPPKPGWDSFCWKCHTSSDLIPCSKCIRSYHLKCLKKHAPAKLNTWICPECVGVENFMRGMSRTWKGSPLTAEQINQLLQFALKRMRQLKGHEFVDGKINEEEFPEYYKYIVNPVTLETLQKKVENKVYKCAEEFAVEAKWIHHNTIIYFGGSGKIPNVAKSVVKVCRQEVTEIDTCPECYYNANTSKDWFVEVCSRPHILLWAKLKGFPYWPAKAMGINSAALVNVRFFGDYDRAYVPVKECFLYSEKDPNPPTKQNKRNNMAGCIKEVDIHIKKIIAKFGSFKFAPFKTLYDPGKELDQLEMMIPGVIEQIKKAQAAPKPTLTYKIVKSADNHLSIIKKSDINGGDNKSSENKTINFVAVSDGSKDTMNIVERKSSENSEVGFNTKSPDSSPTKSGAGTSIKTYEVVTKKDESDVSKVSSVILKRKSDNWNAVSPTSNKKQKSIENENSRGEQTVSSSSDSGSAPTHIDKTAVDSKEDFVVSKRKRSQDGSSPKAQKPRTEDDDDNNSTPVMVLTVEQSSLSNSGVSTQVSSSVASLVASSSLSTISNLAREDEVESGIENNNKSISSEKSHSESNMDSSTSKDFPSSQDSASSKHCPSLKVASSSKDSLFSKDSPPPKESPSLEQSPSSKDDNKESEEKLQEKNVEDKPPENAPDNSSVPEEVVRNEMTTFNTECAPISASVEQPQSSTLSVTKSCELIPFAEIKTEKPDVEDETQKSPVESVEVRSKTATPEQRQSVQSVISISSESTQQQSSLNEIEKVTVKTEISSDDEECSDPLKTDSTTEKLENPEPNKSPERPIQRITVRDIATLRVQPNTKKTQVVEKKKTAGVMKVEVKKQNQRARKSFPNKTPFTATTTSSPSVNICPSKRPGMASITYQCSKNINNMVYIPVDSKGQTSIHKAIPIPPLTAVSKINIGQSAAMTSTTPQSSTTTTTTAKTPHIAVTLPTQIQVDINLQQTTPLQAISSESGTNKATVTQAISPPTMSPTTVSTTTGTPNQSNVQNNSSEADHMLSAFVTPNLAAAITDTIVRGPPKLSPKPCRALGSEGDSLFPSKAGPVCNFLMENSHKMSDFFRSVIEDTLADMSSSGILEAKVKLMELEMEKMKHSYEKQLEELKHNTDLMLCEMRNSWEKERTSLIAETRKQCEMERIRAIEECKKKQWCANCGKEAQFYCCWNTSYCDYPCQQKHWTRHMSSCAQNDNPDVNAQKIGVKITPFNVKDKKVKNSEAAIPNRMPGNNFVRAAMPGPRNPVPVQRLIPISANSGPPRYTLLNREGNWELMPSPTYQRVLPTGVIMTDSNGKATVGTSPRTNQM